jgi:predicted MFS family arabinose efflux permease
LLGTILAGIIEVEWAALAVVLTAMLGYWTGRQVPPAPPEHNETSIDWHILRSSIRLVSETMHIRKLYLAIASISFFWTIGAVLFIQFPPLAKNVLGADKEVASLFLAIFSVGIAIGSVVINRLLKGQVSARFAPVSVIVMGLFVVAFHLVCKNWHVIGEGELYNITGFIAHPDAIMLLATLLGIAVTGGMFVVPLYAYLTTSVPKDQTARTVAANNIVNSGAMVIGSLIALGLSAAGVTIVNQLLLGAAMCLVSAWLAQQLHKATIETAV